MHLYTPWGWISSRSSRTGQLKGIDLRALNPTANSSGPMSSSPKRRAGDRLRHSAGADGEQAARIGACQGSSAAASLFVRALERLVVIDWSREHRLDRSMVAVVLAAAKIVPPATGLSFLFTVADQLINWAQDWYAADLANPYAFMTFEAASAGGAGGISFVMDMYEESVTMAKEGRPMLASHGLTIAQFAYSAGMFAAVRGTDWYFFKTVRDINRDTRGYCHAGRCSALSGMIPPVMIHVQAAGPLEQPLDNYPAAVHRMMVFRLETGTADYHADWLNGRKGPNAPLADLPFNDYAPGEWPVVVTRTEPDYQVIRLAIPKSAIAPEVWGDRPQDAPLSSFAPVVTLVGPDGESTSIGLIQESARRSAESAANFYATVVLMRDDGEIPLLPGLATFAEPYDSAREQRVDFAGPLLRTRLQGTLAFGDERSKPLSFAIDFSQPQRPATEANALPPRTHVREVALTKDIFGIYDLTSWTVTGGTPEWLANYADLRNAYAPCATTPSACYLRVLRAGEQRSVAELFGKHGEGLSFERFADSQLYLEGWGKDGQYLAPVAHENFFKLDGPILTGSSFWNVGGYEPGTPALVSAWNTIRAEFKDGRVTGTLSEHQIIENVEVVTISFAFEGVLRK